MPEPHWIFVFGSNKAGRHGAGAALVALTAKGARLGVGRGMCGQSYALPTKDENVQTMPLADIAYEAAVFRDYARTNSHRIFQLTAVGCGLAGYTPEEIAPLFRNCTTNVFYPPEWREVLADEPDFRFWSYAQPVANGPTAA